MNVLFSGIHHCSIVVTDLDRARRFYADVLRLKEIPKPRTFDFSVAWFDMAGQHIHLIPRDRPDNISPRHVALHTGDAAQARDHFRRHDVLVRETTPIPGADRFFINDPDGNQIEIIQWLRPYDPEENRVP